MSKPLTLELLIKTFDDLPMGVGIFKVHDLKDIKNIEYVFMNKVILYEMRKTKEEVFGKRIIEVAPEAYEHEGGLFVMETYRRIAEEGGSVNLGLVEYSNHMVAGTYECSVHHIEDNYVYVMLRNVTDLEKAKHELELKNKELSQFAYTVSHDLKEPLRTVSSYIEILKDLNSSKFDEESIKLLDYVKEASIRMNHLISDLLDYSGIGKGKEKSTVDCNHLVKMVLDDLAIMIKEKNATIHIEELPTLNGYATELRLLFQNLISNAIKFCPADRQPNIQITASKNEHWTFRIQDNGIGIDKENLESIFNVFTRLHSKKEFEGSGIGLAHCKKIIDLHEGTIWVESSPNEGSTFCFTIPQ